ncbi:MAG: outer membrane protein [Gammaproteobacteria bacterium]
MNKQILLAPLLLGATLAAQANHYEISAMGGMAISELSNNESVKVHPLVTNDYETDEDVTVGPAVGLGLRYGFDGLAHDNLSLTLGVSGYYINYGDITGTEYPFVNGGSFDTLDYHFRTRSFALMFEPRLVYSKYVFQPYLITGIGSAWNRAYNYKEAPTDPNGSAAPAPHPFRSQTVNAFAYEVGIGVQYKFDKDIYHHLVSLDYRYMNMGHADLGTMSGQLTDDHLEVSPLATQTIMLSLTTAF